MKTVSQKDAEKETENKRGRRAAVVILGGLAAGAVLSGAPTTDTATSIHDQFQSAYVAGSAHTGENLVIEIVLGDG